MFYLMSLKKLWEAVKLGGTTEIRIMEFSY